MMPGSKWRVYGASVQGTSHVKSGLPCQDAHASLALQNGDMILAIGDGAGSADRSQEGSRIAVDRVVAELWRTLQTRPKDPEEWAIAFRTAFHVAREALVGHAHEQQIPLGSLATTLTCAVVRDDLIVLAQIGDGVGAIQSIGGELLTMVQPVRGEFANETFFLTGKDALERIEFWAERKPIRALVLSTDGLLRLAFVLPEHTPFAPFLEPVIAFATEEGPGASVVDTEAKLQTFLQADWICKRTDDDKTLLIAVRTDLPPLVRAEATESTAVSAESKPETAAATDETEPAVELEPAAPTP